MSTLLSNCIITLRLLLNKPSFRKLTAVSSQVRLANKPPSLNISTRLFSGYVSESDPKSSSLKEFCRRMPKLELHAHLNGSLSPQAIQKLIELKKEKISDSLYFKPVTVAASHDDIKSVFDIFKQIHELTDSCEAIFMATVEVVCEFADDNVKYLELRSTPKALPGTSLDFESYIRSMIAAIDACKNPSRSSTVTTTKNASEIIVKLLPSIDRSRNVDTALDIVRLAAKLRCDKTLAPYIVGIDLGGNPAASNIRDFIPAFELARQEDLQLAVHMSEVPEDVGPVLIGGFVDRIGHGTFLRPEKGGKVSWMDIIKEKRIPIECCLTSNLKCKTISHVDNHHMKPWLDEAHPVVICTDDPGVMGTCSSLEHYKAAVAYDLSPKKLLELTLNAVDFSFCSGEEKAELRSLISKFN